MPKRLQVTTHSHPSDYQLSDTTEGDQDCPARVWAAPAQSGAAFSSVHMSTMCRISYLKNILVLLLVISVSCSTEHGSPGQPQQDYLYGKVVKVVDGDTLTILTNEKRQDKIRLAEIDAPERGQPFGELARKQLANMVDGKDVAVHQIDTDRYGRIVARVYAGDLYVNAALVRLGAAWVYDKYATDKALYALQEDAQKAKRGL